MKFPGFKEYRGNTLEAYAKPEELLSTVVKYLSVDLIRILRELINGLDKLSFQDNFQSFTIQVTIPASTEIAIANNLRESEIPNYRLILRGGSGSENIVDGDTEWSKEFVYLKNTGLVDAIVTVVFFR